jgi:prepilin-type N-terminal cleavage/methylation domain-containing protein
MRRIAPNARGFRSVSRSNPRRHHQTDHSPDSTRARGDSHRDSRDRGVSLIEILISVVLLGLGIVAMLTTLGVAIDASATERDHANAHAWLQSAADVLYGHERLDCGTQSASLEPTIRAAYETAVQTADNPEGWTDDRIRIVAPVLFWDGEIYQSTCYDDENINLQLITIEVRNPSNEIVETVQVVKG